jgi:RNA polymerase sigma-B factor
MMSRDRGAGGGRALPRSIGLHRSRAQAGERQGPDALARAYACTRDPATRAALVELCEPLVRGLAAGYGQAAAGLHDDLIQEGFLGLLRAIDRYDPARGTPFLAFARHFVRGGITHYVRDYRWVIRRPRWMHPARAPMTLSLDALLDQSGANAERSGPRQAILVSRQEVDDDRAALLEAIGGLRPMQRAVVFHLYFGDLTQVETAASLGISQKHVSRVLAGALRTLRNTLTPTLEFRCNAETDSH